LIATATAKEEQAGRPRIWPIAVFTSRGNVRQPMVYVTLAAMPASYFLVFTLLDGETFGRQALIGAGIAFAVTGGVVSLPQTVVLYRMRRLHDMIVASPIRMRTYLAGLALSRLLYVAPPLGVVIVAFAIFGHVAPWRIALLLPFVAAAWLFGSSIGFSISRRWDNPAYISAISNMIGYLLVLLPPVYYPLSLLPAGARLPLSLIPTAGLAEMARWATGIASPSAITIVADAAVTVILIIASLIYAVSDSRWREL
jgi:ABC-2 type transport system permease protein